MRQQQFNKVIILSAEDSTLSTGQNSQRTSNLALCLQDCNITYTTVLGVYKGSKEVSFMVVPRDSQEISTLKDFAFKSFNQESILLRDHNGQTSLIFQDGSTQDIGVFTQVNPKQIEQLDSYTVINNRVFTTVKG